MFTLFVSPYVNLIICINSYSACLSFLKFLDGILWGQPQPPHTSNLDLEVKVTGIWTCPRLLVSTPTVSTSKSYVTSFSSYYIHKLVCPHCPLTCRGDANTPSTFLQPRDKNRLTGHRFSLAPTSAQLSPPHCTETFFAVLHEWKCCFTTTMKIEGRCQATVMEYEYSSVFVFESIYMQNICNTLRLFLSVETS